MSPFNKNFRSAGPKKSFGGSSRGSARPPSRGYSAGPSSYSSRPKSGGFRSAPYHGTSSAPRAPYHGGQSTGGYQGSHPSTGGYQGSRSSGGNTSHYSRGRSFGGGGHRGGGNRGGGKSEHINFSRFINKAVITEETEHFKPEHTFADFKIDEAVKTAVISKGYELPTPIQDRAIPHILQGSDIVGIANTGTGKTAAFLIPLINKVKLNPKEQVLIISPTRELSIQIDDELKSFVKGMKIYSVCCVGGAPIGKQIRDLQYQYNFIIGTPGRLKDLIDRKLIKLSEFQTVVLDEADRMLDMGFVNDMRAIMQGMPKVRHTLFFSATLSPDIEKIIKDFLKEPVRISVKTQDTSKNVDQDVVHIKAGETKI
ncbi:MAG TPA: DEAD/DEAH box helicase, partial [Candidatus Paceibacterota bacterium]|nr:DEAD/DEAH box helicase [Candidatus Paceibacterota bacterium]